MAAPAFPVPQPDNTIGALQMGWGASALALGLLISQVFTYYTKYPNDSPWNKLLVAVLILLEITHQVLVGYCTWHYAVGNWGSFLPFLQDTTWSLSAQVGVSALISYIVKACFAMRVYKFSKSFVVTLIIAILASATFGLTMAFTVLCSRTKVYQLGSLSHIGIPALAVGAVTDVFTAMALTVSLLKMRTGFKRPDSLISKMVLYSVSTGAITALSSVIVLILYAKMPLNFAFAAVFFVSTRLYANAVFTTLNTRRFSAGGKGTDRQGPSSFALTESNGRAHSKDGLKSLTTNSATRETVSPAALMAPIRHPGNVMSIKVEESDDGELTVKRPTAASLTHGW